MSTKIFSLAVLVLGVLTQSSNAYFRMSCAQMAIGRIDPVVSFGKIGPHAHKISGASNIGLNSTFSSLQTANCTSCEIQADKSAYWTPILYYQHSNGSFEEVPNGGMTIYYLGRGDNRTNIVPFPPGLRMVSGDATLRSYNTEPMTYMNARPIADRVSFACLDENPSKETPLMNNTQCSNGLRAQIHFQSCWDGTNLYKPDNSHVAYMSGMDNGQCPPTHAMPLPHLFFEVLYSVASINEDGGKFVFSTGDTTGAGFHGDFMNGWDEGVLKDSVEQCIRPDGGDMIDTCAPLQKSHVKDIGNSCPMQAPVTDEPVKGMIEKLPGCAKVTEGPDPAPDAGCPGDDNANVGDGGAASAVNGTVGGTELAGNATDGGTMVTQYRTGRKARMGRTGRS